MRLRVYTLLLAGTGLAVANPLHVMITTTDVSAFRLGHAAANVGSTVDPDTKPTKMRHLCKNMQKVVQDTAARLLSIIGISGTGPAPISDGGLTRIEITHHNLVPVRVIEPAFVIKGGPYPDATMNHHGVHKFHKHGPPQGPFLHRVHRALLSLGPWEGRIVAFVLGCGLGVLLRMFWVLAVLLTRSIRRDPEHEETTLVYAEEVPSAYRGTAEKVSNSTDVGDN